MPQQLKDLISAWARENGIKLKGVSIKVQVQVVVEKTTPHAEQPALPKGRSQWYAYPTDETIEEKDWDLILSREMPGRVRRLLTEIRQCGELSPALTKKHGYRIAGTCRENLNQMFRNHELPYRFPTGNGGWKNGPWQLRKVRLG